MGFRIRTNIPAMFAQRQLSITNMAINKNLERLSSGYRINRAADDAAGLAISEKLRTQVNGLTQARLNVQDAISVIQTAEGGIIEISDMLQRLRTLAIQAANDILTTSDRRLIQLEFNQILHEIDRMVSTVEFNTKQLLTGNYWTGGHPGSLVFHVGANSNQILSVQIPSLSTASLGTTLGSNAGGTKLSSLIVDSTTGYSNASAMLTIGSQRGAGIMTRSAAETAIGVITSALNTISDVRATLGAFQNRMERTFNFLGTAKENMAASESRIRDVDIAEEIVSFTKNQILVQTGTAILAQANVAPQSVLQLLQ